MAIRKVKYFILLVCVFTLVSCDKSVKINGYLDCTNRKTLGFTYNTSKGLAWDIDNNVYVVYGEYATTKSKIPSGVVVTSDGYKRYSILKLLLANKYLRSEAAIKAAAIQQQMFKEKLPEYYSPESELAGLGAHGMRGN